MFRDSVCEMAGSLCLEMAAQFVFRDGGGSLCLEMAAAVCV